MKWVRRILVFLFSIILLVSLVGIALSTSAEVSLTHPNKIETWLDKSNIYSSLSTTIVSKAQKSIASNVPGGVSISKSVVKQAANSAFPQSLLKQSAQTFITNNYVWVEGKTAKPNFTIDLSGAKQEFATKVANASVLSHLTSLPICSAAQTLQLESASPLLLSCLPAGVSPELETSQISQQVVSSSGFLNNPVITAGSVSLKGLNNGEPYYKKLSELPRTYQLAQKLPWILSIVSLISILLIIFCARTKRSGVRITDIVILISGILLVANKFSSDEAYNRLKDHFFKNVGSSQIQQSLVSFVHYIETEVAKINLWFGIGYIVIAMILLCILVLIRHHSSLSKARVTNKSTNGEGAITPADNIYGTGLSKQPEFDAISPSTKTATPTKKSGPAPQSSKKRTHRKPPGLIQ